MPAIKGLPSTQQHLDIADIKEGLLVLKNGVVSLILETTSLNFDLLSEREQDAKILSFSGLLNSLSFHIQILIRTHRTDLSDYVELLEEQMKKQISEGLRKQMEIYIQFIRNLTVTNEVLEKRFFIVIPSSTGMSIRPGLFKKLFGKGKEDVVNVDQAIDRAKTKLFPRRDHIIKQLKRMGLFARQLNSSEIVKLFYGVYNPSRQGLEKLQITRADVDAPMIEAKTQ
ncbi:MAG: hypothetical protein PHS44_02545 [Candidatus Dojkabacteria bacterium]|jgi:hypothetical protein|nr:hypothetical protein [Candidatus Dojkabacteria bacterium]